MEFVASIGEWPCVSFVARSFGDDCGGSGPALRERLGLRVVSGCQPTFEFFGVEVLFGFAVISADRFSEFMSVAMGCGKLTRPSWKAELSTVGAHV